MKHLAGLRLSPDQHQQLVDICDSPATFPSTYEAWLENVQKGEAEALQSGDTVRAVEFEVDDFVRWCHLVGIVPCIDALKAYAIVQRLDPSETPYSTMPPPTRHGGNGRSA